jgi:hypothetical protein
LRFVRMRQCGDDVREMMHDGCPVACVQDAPFGYVNSFKSHVNVGFFYTAALRDLIDAAYLDIRARLGGGASVASP